MVLDNGVVIANDQHGAEAFPASEDAAGLARSRRITLGELLRAAARRTPDRVGFVVGDVSRTMAELDRRVDRLAQALIARGVELGDRIAVLMTNHMEMIEALFAITRLGATAVPINFRLVAHEVEFLIADSGARVMIVDSEMAALAGEVRDRVPALAACLVVGDALEAAGSGAEAYEEALAAAGTEPVEVDVPEHAPAFIMYTSGTTGLPKGAVLTHMNFVLSGMSVAVPLGVEGETEVWLSGLPLFHIGGIDCFVPYVFVSGGTVVVLPSGRFSPEEVLETFERAGVTGCFFVPAQWQAICEVEGMEERPLRLKRIAFGAAPTLAPLLDRLARRFPGVTYLNAFGMTECVGTTTLYSETDAFFKLGSVGKPIPTVELRIVDENMEDVQVGQVGEVVYRGPVVFSGYWQRPQETAEAFAGGWFHSGDLCYADEDGYIYAVDRKKDMIISGGENIYSAEVESVLEANPQVHEVAVIGIPHAEWGETPQAVIVPTDPADPPTLEAVTAWCRERLAAYKKPTSVRILQQLPRNASGKVLKHRLRAEAQSDPTPPPAG
jgi:acyl-CoA synthetase (AMP-forming)/AMP-acid ligase II